MKKSTNKLLTALTAVGIVTGVNVAEAEAANNFGSFTEFFEFVTVSFSADLQAKVDFVRSYPTSPAAAGFAKEIAETLDQMPPADRANAVAELNRSGGLPAEVTANISGLGSVATSAVGPKTRPRGMDVAGQKTDGVKHSRNFGSTDTSVY